MSEVVPGTLPLESGGCPIVPGGLSPTQALQLSPVLLAYIGDAVYELYVRSAFLLPPKSIRHYHQQVVQQVRAEGQVQQLERLLDHLDAGEKDIIRRGRNAVAGHNRRSDPKNYRQATGLEALVGYLYLTNPERLNELWQHLDFRDDFRDPPDLPQ
jgi:ribonuclease-3 family protein